MVNLVTIKSKIIWLDKSIAFYIRQSERFDVRVMWELYNPEFFYDKYSLILAGNKEDLQEYYSYLKDNYIRVIVEQEQIFD